MARHKITNPSYKYLRFPVVKIEYFWGECLGLVVDSKFQYNNFDTKLHFYISDRNFTVFSYLKKTKRFFRPLSDSLMILTKKNIFVPEWNNYDEADWFLVNYSSGRFSEDGDVWVEESF